VDERFFWLSMWIAPAGILLLFFYLWKPDAPAWRAVRKPVNRTYFLSAVLLVAILSIVQNIVVGINTVSNGSLAAAFGARMFITETPFSMPDTPTATPTLFLPSPSPSPSREPESTLTPTPTPTAAPTSTPTPTFTPDPLADPAACIPQNAPRQPAELVEILDGDTIRVRLEDGSIYQVRYLGMDTPERGELYSNETTHMNEDLLSLGPLSLVLDVSDKDRYDRLLRHIFAGEVFVNLEMVRLGFASTMLISPDLTCAETFLAAEAAAREANAGLWGLPTPTPLPPPSPTPAGAQEFTVLSLSSPVNTGSKASLSIQTQAGSSCHLSYTTPAGTKSQAKGLGETAAGASGVCSWSWTIGSSTRPGTGNLKVTAAGFTKNLQIVITSR
jgi:endonuclease YncB( thermonuclease family)